MIKHIVMWKMKDGVTLDQKKEVKTRLEALQGVISELVSIEVGIDYVGSKASADVSLISSFASKEDLAAYQVHPAHQAVGVFLKTLVAERRAADYEC